MDVSIVVCKYTTCAVLSLVLFNYCLSMMKRQVFKRALSTVVSKEDSLGFGSGSCAGGDESGEGSDQHASLSTPRDVLSLIHPTSCYSSVTAKIFERLRARYTI